jgi:hypothetical protein
VWMEGIHAEVSRFEDHSRLGDCAVVGATDKRNADALGRLENGEFNCL